MRNSRRIKELFFRPQRVICARTQIESQVGNPWWMLHVLMETPKKNNRTEYERKNVWMIFQVLTNIGKWILSRVQLVQMHLNVLFLWFEWEWKTETETIRTFSFGNWSVNFFYSGVSSISSGALTSFNKNEENHKQKWINQFLLLSMQLICDIFF